LRFFGECQRVLARVGDLSGFAAPGPTLVGR
jgi:hypothetical protein